MSTVLVNESMWQNRRLGKERQSRSLRLLVQLTVILYGDKTGVQPCPPGWALTAILNKSGSFFSAVFDLRPSLAAPGILAGTVAP